MANDESHEKEKNLPGPTIQIPFLKTDIPELNQLPPEERQKIAETCCNAPEMQRLSRQQLLLTRLAVIPLLLGIGAWFFPGQLGFSDSQLSVLMPLAMLIAILTFAGSFLLYSKRSTRLLKQLIEKELNRIRKADT